MDKEKVNIVRPSGLASGRLTYATPWIKTHVAELESGIAGTGSINGSIGEDLKVNDWADGGSDNAEVGNVELIGW